MSTKLFVDRWPRMFDRERECVRRSGKLSRGNNRSGMETTDGRMVQPNIVAVAPVVPGAGGAVGLQLSAAACTCADERWKVAVHVHEFARRSLRKGGAQYRQHSALEVVPA